MENVATDENWKTCFSQLAPGLVLFARQWARSPADAEDIVQEAFVRFWRKQNDIATVGFFYAALGSFGLDFLRGEAGAVGGDSPPASELVQLVNPSSGIG